QSFIQPLSEPIYTHRPEVPIAVAQQTMPETHEAAQGTTVQSEMMNNALTAPPRPMAAGAMGAIFASGTGGNTGGGLYQLQGVYRGTDALQAGDVSTSGFDDYFEYALAQPVTIHKNQSAMVPILQESLPAEHVTLWSDRKRVPLRAVWLDNQSKLTLDAGSFSIFENGEFAGEGLLDPIHPGEKRLLSYAVDQAVKVQAQALMEKQILHHVAMRKGVLIRTTDAVTEHTYTITNASDEARTVIVEHTRIPGAKLESDQKPAETTATAYRFRVSVDPHQSADLRVAERSSLSAQVQIDPDNDQSAFILQTARYAPELEEKLRPLIDAETALSGLNAKIEKLQQDEKTLSGDEARDRDNITALKGNEAAKRFVDELNRAEDALETARKSHADLEKQRDAARATLDSLIAQMSFETDLDVPLTNQNE
ncbi:MAG TPA: hypothetical protein VGG26_00645, partial [Terracidiphilus sp.]